MSEILKALAGGKKRVSFEVVPPSRGSSPDSVLSAIENLLPWEPAFVSVTDHPHGRYWREQDGKPVAMPARVKPGTFGLSIALRDKLGVVPVPHVICVGNDVFRAEDDLIDIAFAGFSDVLLLRGDQRFSPFTESPGPGELVSALDLLRLYERVKNGQYSGRDRQGMSIGLSAGVAAYPEKHMASPNMEADIAQLKAKVDAGAEWAITQMVFDAGFYKSFIGKILAHGIQIPVIPGVKVLTSRRSLTTVPGAFGVNIPLDFYRSMEEARTAQEERLTGIRFAARLAEGLLDAGAPGLHFFTMGKAEDTRECLRAVFGDGGAK